MAPVRGSVGSPSGAKAFPANRMTTLLRSGTISASIATCARCLIARIDAYVRQATPARRQSVPVTELMTVFQDLPPMSAEALRADQDRYADAAGYFDAYERIHDA